MTTKQISVGPRKRAKKIKVGEHVFVPRGTREIVAEVIEDRGMIGVGGRQLIRVRVHPGTEMESEYEIPAERVRRRAD